jgi:methylenetetrahydrofolate dehydrogenase (NADP+)/methenyltetrahydrofolate cyclohydrolase
MIKNGEKVPHLAAVIVGNDGASLTYVGSKVKACQRVGFESTLVKMPSTTSETELLKKIKELNEMIILTVLLSSCLYRSNR